MTVMTNRISEGARNKPLTCINDEVTKIASFLDPPMQVLSLALCSATGNHCHFVRRVIFVTHSASLILIW